LTCLIYNKVSARRWLAASLRSAGGAAAVRYSLI
jgi:hypothetical protein